MNEPVQSAEGIVRLARDRGNLVQAINAASEGATIVVIIGETSKWSWTHNQSASTAQMLALGHRFIARLSDHILAGRMW